MAESVSEHYLYPGGIWFGSRKTQLRTLLGSCVAITLWHPGLRVGGMCHYLLPENPLKDRIGVHEDTRYADHAMRTFLRGIKKARTCPMDYQVGLFGGGNMFTALEREWSVDIGSRNIAAGYLLLQRSGFATTYEDLGGKVHRQITLDMSNGTLFLRRGTEQTLVLPAL